MIRDCVSLKSSTSARNPVSAEIHLGSERLGSAQARFNQGDSQSAFRTVVRALNQANFY